MVADFMLEIHELGNDGEIRCGVKASAWQGKSMKLVTLGRGRVTCKRCARMRGH